ncbi:MAG: hypothetical protein L6Q35_15060 [Phycisphaerales bacterium]|nr:hypothetical protein [Phycisphaerales bacterium]
MNDTAATTKERKAADEEFHAAAARICAKLDLMDESFTSIERWLGLEPLALPLSAPEAPGVAATAADVGPTGVRIPKGPTGGGDARAATVANVGQRAGTAVDHGPESATGSFTP